MRLLFLAALLLVTGCATQLPPETHNVVPINPEAAVAFAYLDKTSVRNAQETILDTLAVGDLGGHFFGKSYQQFRHDLLADHGNDIPDDLIRDFCRKNRFSHHIWPELHMRQNAVLLSEAEMKFFFANHSRQKPDGWDRFYAKYPHSYGIVTLSRVGFNRERTKAMFYVDWTGHWLLGHGEMHVMEKQNGKWVEIDAPIGPMTIS